MSTRAMNFFSTVALLAATLVFFEWSDRRPPEYLARPLESISSDINGWSLEGAQPLDDQTLRVLHPTNYISRSYGKNNQHLGLFIAFYAQQRAGETMHSPKNCLPGSGWEIWKSEIAEVALEGRTFQINKFSIQNSGQRLQVYYWYQSRDRIIADEYLGKLLLIRDAIRDASAAGALVRVTVADDPQVSTQALQFSAGVIPQLQSCFARGRSAPNNVKRPS